MRLSRLVVPALAGGLGVALAAGPAALGDDAPVPAEVQTLTLDASNGTAISAAPLTAGVTYGITVSGTYSVVSGQRWARGRACGAPDAAPARPSPKSPNGPAGRDVQSVYALPAGTGGCNRVLPRHHRRFEIDTGDGFRNIDPIGGAVTSPAPDHTYTFNVVGQDHPAAFRIVDSPANDNYGVLNIRIGGPGTPESTTTTAASTPATAPPATAPPTVTASADGITIAGDGAPVPQVVRLGSARLHLPHRRGACVVISRAYVTGTRIRSVTFVVDGRLTSVGRTTGATGRWRPTYRRRPVKRGVHVLRVLVRFVDGTPPKRFVLRVDRCGLPRR